MKKFFYLTGFFIMTYLFVLLVIKLSFQKSIPESHRAFIEEKGWDLAFYLPDKEPFSIPEYNEALQFFHLAGVDFQRYEKTKITQHTYRLKQKCDVRYLEAIILTADAKIIDSFIKIEDTDPGVTEMTDKVVYMKRDFCH